ncbi:HIRAN domain-containing protein [Paenibacillus odorifer]|uniref:HIRAN domain-containing protein n=1 Tax=Paenibacillus TaxID=44249 RepID=UPI0009D78A3A|nr:HIRAN domain-containing protein [Paenibacillus odorifer]
MLRKCSAGQDITLKRKPSKKFPDAIEVWVKQEQIGHIDADDASILAPILDRRKRFKVTIKKITGGTESKPTLGCIISLKEN